MGQCCGRSKNTKRVLMGYRTPLLCEPLLSEPDKLPGGNSIVVVRLVSLDNIGSNSLKGAADSFVELRLLPSDEVAGFQLQRSEIRTDSNNPVWTPSARFDFLVSRLHNSKIVVSVYNFQLIGEHLQLGDAVLHLKDISHKSMIKVLKLHTDDGTRGQVHLEYYVNTPDQQSREQEHMVYEFQRWQPGRQWGFGHGHFLPSDPGRWGSADGSVFHNNIDAVAQPIPEGWVVRKSWYTMATDKDPDGWQYAIDFYAPYWYNVSDGVTLFVRRRPMTREIVLP